MSKLRFQALIDLYEAQEADVRRKLGLHERARGELLARLDTLTSQRDAVKVADPRLRDIYIRFCQLLADQIAGVKDKIAGVDRDIVACRAELVEAHRKSATFAKLRARELAERARRNERRQARLLDELGARRWAEAHR
jgi:flagellar export protein FliJ